MAKSITFGPGTGRTGPGMDQGSARRRAKELGGIARSARPGRNGWITGGWPTAGDVWIVVLGDLTFVDGPADSPGTGEA